MSGVSAGASRVRVLTDQQVNHGPHLAFVRAVGRQAGLRSDITPIHVFAPKAILGGARPVEVELRLRRSGVTCEAPLVIFRDSECRSESDRIRVRASMDELVTGLHALGFARCCGVVLDPFSEAALLIADDWLQLAAAGARDTALLDRHVREKRANRFVHKDQLDTNLSLRGRKVELNRLWAVAINSAHLPDCDHTCFRAAVETIAAVLG